MEFQLVKPGDRPFIHSYRANGFTISGNEIEGSVLVTPDRVQAWPLSDIAELTVEHLSDIANTADDIEVLLIGCGPKMLLLPAPVRASFAGFPFSVDVMETGAACRTYNVLIGESRRVAAALTPIG